MKLKQIFSQEELKYLPYNYVALTKSDSLYRLTTDSDNNGIPINSIQNKNSINVGYYKNINLNYNEK